MSYGKLEKWVHTGGFGFIKVIGENVSAFVHAKTMRHAGIDVVNLDDEYHFDLVYDAQKRARAENITRVSSGFGESCNLVDRMDYKPEMMRRRQSIVHTGGGLW
ncbi:MAG: cold shock domain-containing protein [Verrucomicrobiota bacterium]